MKLFRNYHGDLCHLAVYCCGELGHKIYRGIDGAYKEHVDAISWTWEIYLVLAYLAFVDEFMYTHTCTTDK